MADTYIYIHIYIYICYMEIVQLIKGIAEGWRTSFRFPAVLVTHHKPVLRWNHRPTIHD